MVWAKAESMEPGNTQQLSEPVKCQARISVPLEHMTAVITSHCIDRETSLQLREAELHIQGHITKSTQIGSSCTQVHRTPVFQFHSVTVTNTVIKSTWRRKGFIWITFPGHGPSLRNVMAETEGRSLKQKTRKDVTQRLACRLQAEIACLLVFLTVLMPHMVICLSSVSYRTINSIPEQNSWVWVGPDSL